MITDASSGSSSGITSKIFKKRSKASELDFQYWQELKKMNSS